MRLLNFVFAALLAGSSVASPMNKPHPNYVTTITTTFDGKPTTQTWTIDPPTGRPMTVSTPTGVVSSYTSVATSPTVVSSFTSGVATSPTVVSSFTSVATSPTIVPGITVPPASSRAVSRVTPSASRAL